MSGGSVIMTYKLRNPRKLNSVAILIFGVLFVLASIVCLLLGFTGQKEYDRWKAVPPIQQIGALEAVAQGSDVAVVGTIAPWTSATVEGFALYQKWECEIKQSGRQKRRVCSMTEAYRPDFELLLGDEAVAIRAGKASLGNAREVELVGDARLEGLAPGDEVTVLGTRASTDEPGVQAQVVCGGGWEACVQRYAESTTFAGIVAAVVLLVGGVLIWVGIRQLRR